MQIRQVEVRRIAVVGSLAAVEDSHLAEDSPAAEGSHAEGRRRRGDLSRVSVCKDSVD